MKLLQKINREYLSTTLLVFGVFLLVLYFIIQWIMEEELKENMTKDELRVVGAIASVPGTFEIFPLVDVSVADSVRPPEFRDTEIFDPVEGEKESYKELHTYRNINGKVYHIVIRSSSVASDDLAQLLFLVIGGFFLVSAGVMFIINRRINRKVWKPFYDNLEKLKEFSLPDSTRLEFRNSGISEFRELYSSLTELTERITSDYYSLKLFTENAAHELQNPLAVIQGKLEILMNGPGISESQMEHLQSIRKATGRLVRLNKGLLLLARLESGQYSDRKKVNITGMAKKALDHYSDILESKKLRLREEFLSEIEVEMDENQAEMLVHNLIGNAIIHSGEEGRIELLSQDNILIIGNSGSSVIRDSDRIFDRFYKADASSGSLGLGLSIVKKICDINSFAVIYNFRNGMHCFSVTF